MADLNQSLKDYLARPQKNGGNNDSGPKSSYFSGWFPKGTGSDDRESSEVANGWFSDAQNDPFLPSLVSWSLISPLLFPLFIDLDDYSIQCSTSYDVCNVKMITLVSTFPFIHTHLLSKDHRRYS